MGQRPRIVVIGSANTDMVVRAPRIPAPGETILGGRFVMVAGGKGANQAVAAARMGAEVSFVGCVGDDAFGERSLEGLRAEGIDVSACARTASHASGVALIAVDDHGQNAIVVAPGANMAMTNEIVDAAEPRLEAADCVILQCEVPIPVVEHAAKRSKGMGKLVVLNPAPASRLPASLLESVDILTPNESEAAALLGGTADGIAEDAEHAAIALLARGPTCAVITLGSRGVVTGLVHDGVTRTSSPPGFAVEATDATAAGDCFTAALACILAEPGFATASEIAPAELASATRFAQAAAAVSVTRLGAQPSLPRRHEVEAFLAGH